MFVPSYSYTERRTTVWVTAGDIHGKDDISLLKRAVVTDFNKAIVNITNSLERNETCDMLFVCMDRRLNTTYAHHIEGVVMYE